MEFASGQRLTPNVTVEFAMDVDNEPTLESVDCRMDDDWLCNSTNHQKPRLRSNSCGLVEPGSTVHGAANQDEQTHLATEAGGVSGIDLDMQRVCQALEDGVRLNVPLQTATLHQQRRKNSLSVGTLVTDVNDASDAKQIRFPGRTHSAMSSRGQLHLETSNAFVSI